MGTVEFQAKVENGVIVVPQEYQQLAKISTVKIIVLKQTKKQTIQFDIMDELAQNPIAVLGIRYHKGLCPDRRNRFALVCPSEMTIAPL